MKRIGIMVAAVLGMLSFFEEHLKSAAAEVAGHEKTLEAGRNEKGEITLLPDVLEHVQAQHDNANDQLARITGIVDGLRASIDAATNEETTLSTDAVNSIVSSRLSSFETGRLSTVISVALSDFSANVLPGLIANEVKRQLAAAAAPQS